MRTLGLSTCVALAACSFHPPSPGTPGTDAEPGEDMAIPPDEMMMPDARLCFGAGIGMTCLPSEPMAPRALSGMIDTGNDGSCDHVMDVAGTSSCVLVGTTVDLDVGVTFRAHGSRPLVIIASGLMEIEGTLDVGSRRGGGGPDRGAGAPTTLCPEAGNGEGDDGGGGGGAGGSFAGKGGRGGDGDTNNNGFPIGRGDGASSPDAFTPTTLRGGCRGTNGGSGGGGSQTGAGGLGGGAVYLVSGVQIRLSGRVTAHGGGGGGGDEQGGGGGGGSGGMIGLDAPVVEVSGFLVANGGGGGEGGGIQGPDGDPGDNGTEDNTRAAGGVAMQNDGGGGNGGNGGLGSGGVDLVGANGVEDIAGGGGGGGGSGYIYIKGTPQLNGVISPVPSLN